MEFSIRTIDNTYSYSSTIPVSVKWEPETNSKFSDTQGFQRKAQKGDYRMKASVIVKLSATDYLNTFIPMLARADNVYCQFDRLIPSRIADQGTFVFEDIKLVNQFSDDECEVEIILTEVIW